MTFDLVIKNGTLIIPFTGEVKADIGVKDGKIAAIGVDLSGEKNIDARGKYVAPGAVDAHFHIGIYRPMAQDAFEETRSSLVGGVECFLFSSRFEVQNLEVSLCIHDEGCPILLEQDLSQLDIRSS